MPPLPKKKHTRARKGGRSAHHFLTPASISSCPACKAPAMPHRACPDCGYYQGRYYRGAGAQGEQPAGKPEGQAGQQA
ncbi:MAG: 50S ribosomal protein L32 [Dehalococcoidia bacterium]|nr:50S ribosomal protein L32 [Dehalococcoidia bacterium]